MFYFQFTKQAKKAAESIESAVEASKTKVITKGIVKKGTLEDMNFVRKNVVDDLKNAIDRKNDFMKNLGESAESETCHDVNITLPDGLNNVGLGSSRNGGSNIPMKPNRQLSEPCDIYRKTPTKNTNKKLTVTQSAKPRLMNSDTFESTPTSPMRTVDYSKQISHSRTQLSPCVEHRQVPGYQDTQPQEDFFSNIDITGIANQTSDFLGGLLGKNINYF